MPWPMSFLVLGNSLALETIHESNPWANHLKNALLYHLDVAYWYPVASTY